MNTRHNASAGGNRPAPRRRKLWEGKEGYHCSIVGTCLRRADIRRLARKRLYGLSSTMDDFQIHTNLVNQASQRCPQSRALHKLLDLKHRKAINRYKRAEDDDAIHGLWTRDLDKGAVAGAYWAVMTHPTISSELRSQIYGQVHMLSHDVFASSQKERQSANELRSKLALLEKVLLSERQLARKEKKQHLADQDELAKMQATQECLLAEQRELLTRITTLESGADRAELEKRIETLQEDLLAVRQKNAGLQGTGDLLAAQLEQSRELLEVAWDNVDDLESRCKALQREKEELALEILSMETAMILNATTATPDCEHCSDQHTERCPGPDLCGKTVLYVGGLSKMVPRYREMVEKMNGRFIHHDGGKEASRNQLPKMLHTADAVLCPIDCVSHDATNCVKRICKRNQKPYVMMRSSGLSSLAKGLTKIIQ
ncbi:DUF2325 domain-containing protein [Desulfogranum mediterraneum]|uniref:DUF2325 domain-containing protein n=1 Tax=Desulfogranum mediterraneum TaxID=160661 RepID=UPI00048A5D1E|nr:DUF2325 domain-containing protein [Desulfogranum mediterraneum]